MLLSLPGSSICCFRAPIHACIWRHEVKTLSRASALMAVNVIRWVDQASAMFREFVALKTARCWRCHPGTEFVIVSKREAAVSIRDILVHVDLPPACEERVRL